MFISINKKRVKGVYMRTAKKGINDFETFYPEIARELHL